MPDTLTKSDVQFADVPGFTPRTLEVRKQIESGKRLAAMAVGELRLEALAGDNTIWIVMRRPGAGGVALKTARAVGEISVSGTATKSGGKWTVQSSSGVFRVNLKVLSDKLIRVTVTLTPSANLLLPFWSRDLYPLDKDDDPTRTRGNVEAAQRGVNSGFCYFVLAKPSFGSVLYFQNLTALNPYFEATGTKPDGVVGGKWPELGYQPPTSPMGNSPPDKPLEKGVEVTISDAFVAFNDDVDMDEARSAKRFLEMLAAVYTHLERPEPAYHDWIDRAEKTLRDLQKSPESVIEHYGHKYLHPYTESEYPDAMVQMAVLTPLREFEQTFERKIPFADELEAGMGRFFDKDLPCIRRYLPNVGEDKNRNAVDSWYLYHPLMNLARLARQGDRKARKLFLDSIDFGIKAARHFKYRWPIQYDVRDFKAIDAARDDQGTGQTDVGGIYAYVMLQALDLTGDTRFLDEAKAALRALEGDRFELAYQTNLTAWGAIACIRLWQMERDQFYLDQAHVFFASFCHNVELWESQIGHARHYRNFFGVTCLHDAPYMAAYECYEAFDAFDELLKVGGEELPECMRMLALEFWRYSLDRGWYFYPDALPPEAIEQDKIRNGYIDRRLSFPLEDLYGDGQKAGQVGQEIYGAGGAFIFACRAFHQRRGMPFRVFCDYPSVLADMPDGRLALRIRAPLHFPVRIVLMRKNRKPLPRVSVRLEDDNSVVEATHRGDVREYCIASGKGVILDWSRTAG